jgi:hypothetical protein
VLLIVSTEAYVIIRWVVEQLKRFLDSLTQHALWWAALAVIAAMTSYHRRDEVNGWWHTEVKKSSVERSVQIRP